MTLYLGGLRNRTPHPGSVNDENGEKDTFLAGFVNELVTACSAYAGDEIRIRQGAYFRRCGALGRDIHGRNIYGKEACDDCG